MLESQGISSSHPDTNQLSSDELALQSLRDAIAIDIEQDARRFVTAQFGETLGLRKIAVLTKADVKLFLPAQVDGGSTSSVIPTIQSVSLRIDMPSWKPLSNSFRKNIQAAVEFHFLQKGFRLQQDVQGPTRAALIQIELRSGVRSYLQRFIHDPQKVMFIISFFAAIAFTLLLLIWLMDLLRARSFNKQYDTSPFETSVPPLDQLEQYNDAVLSEPHVGSFSADIARRASDDIPHVTQSLCDRDTQPTERVTSSQDIFSGTYKDLSLRETLALLRTLDESSRRRVMHELKLHPAVSDGLQKTLD